MEPIKDIWALVIALAAVINGLGIVRLVGGFSDYLKKHTELNVRHYWVYTLLVTFQLLTHLLLWWSIIGVRSSVDNLNFLTYLYLVVGPTLLFLSTALMVPDIKSKSINLRTEYYSFRKTFFSILIIFWLWAIFIWPVFGHPFAPTVPLIAVWLIISLVLRLTDNPKAHAVLVIANCVVYAAFVAIFAMQLGEVGRRAVE